MKERKTGVVIMILLAVILILVGVVIYAFAIKPAINGYAIEMQAQGYQYAFYQIMQQAAQCQQVPLTLGNQTINVIAVECLQQQPLITE